MSQYFDTGTRPDLAAGAIAQYLRVKTPGAVAVAGAGDQSFGTMDRPCLAAGPCTVRLRTAQGTRKMVANGAITKGNPAYGAASGKVGASGSLVEGIAMETVTADNDVIEVMPLSYSDLSTSAANPAGTGIEGTALVLETSAVRTGGLIKTEILIDLTGLNSGGTAGDIIGKADTANSHIGQITAAVNGTIISGKITCLETPATGDDDIDLYAATEATGVEDTAIASLEETQLCNSGNLTAGSVVVLSAMPAANKYLYLVAQTGDANATYSAGILLIELWGTA